MSQACVPAYLASQVKACNVVKAVVPLDFPEQLNSFNMLVKKEDRLTNNKAGLNKLTRNTMKHLTYAVWRNNHDKLMLKLHDPVDVLRLMIAEQPKTTMWCSSLGVYSVDGGRASSAKDSVTITDRMFRVLALGRFVCSSFVPAVVRADVPFPNNLVCGNVSKTEILTERRAGRRRRSVRLGRAHECALSMLANAGSRCGVAHPAWPGATAVRSTLEDVLDHQQPYEHAEIGEAGCVGFDDGSPLRPVEEELLEVGQRGELHAGDAVEVGAARQQVVIEHALPVVPHADVVTDGQRSVHVAPVPVVAAAVE
jgi:hypothetical protein